MSFLGGLFDPEPTETTTTQTSQLEPWDPAAQGLEDIAGRATELAGVEQEFFPGQTFVGQSPEQQISLQNMYDTAGGYGSSIIDPAMKAWGTTTDQGYYDSASDAYASNVGRQFNENILPHLQQGFTGQGGRRSSRQSLGAQQEADRALGDIARYTGLQDIAYQGMAQTDRGRIMGQAGDMMNLGMRPEQMRYQLQEDMKYDEKMQLGEDMRRHEFEQTQGPWGNLQNAFNILNPLGATYGEQTGTGTSLQEGGGGSPFSKIAGVGMTVAGMMTGNPMLAMGGMGSLSGGGGGGGTPPLVPQGGGGASGIPYGQSWDQFDWGYSPQYF